MNDIDISFWSRGLNFKVYGMGRGLDYPRLHMQLQQYAGNPEKKVQGWLSEEPYATWDEKKRACYVYLGYKKDARLSRIFGGKYMEPDPIAILFDLENQLIIPTTADKNKLSNKVERKALKPIMDATKIDPYTYSGDFLFWLIYVYGCQNGQINDAISIHDISIISSGRESVNLSESIKTNTEVTQYTETLVILGLHGYVTALKLGITADSLEYHLSLAMDGRISADIPEEIEDTSYKGNYAVSIHKAIQQSFATYKSFLEKNDWKKIKGEYQKSCLESSMGKMDSMIQSFRS